MILSKIYEDFIKQTNLTNDIYKSIFVQISDIITKLNSVRWKRLVYSFNNKVYDLKFEEHNVIPIYLIEIIQNIFEQNYSFPEQSITQLFVEYNGMEYEIKANGNIIQIPSEVSFIKQYNLFRFFFLNKPTMNYYSEFDSVFKFLEFFKTTPNSIFQPLRKLFDKDFLKAEVTSRNITDTSVVSDSIIIQNLQIKRQEILKEIDSIREQRDKLTVDKSDITLGFSSRESLMMDREKLIAEYNMIRDSYESYKERDEQLDEILKSIDTELDGLLSVARSQNTDKYASDIEYLKEKKLIFGKEQLSVRKGYSDAKRVFDSVSQQITAIDSKLKTINDYKLTDIKDIEERLYSVDKLQEKLYSDLIQLEHDIKVKKEENLTNELAMTTAQSLADVNIQNIEKTSIVEHLEKSLQPIPLVTVVNYLRYYFIYYVEKSFEIMEQNIKESIEKEWLLAVICRQVLEMYFNVEVQTMFSLITYNSQTIKNFVTVQRG